MNIRKLPTEKNTSKELVEQWNTLFDAGCITSGRRVKKFTSKAVGIRRITEVIRALPAEAPKKVKVKADKKAQKQPVDPAKEIRQQYLLARVEKAIGTQDLKPVAKVRALFDYWYPRNIKRKDFLEMCEAAGLSHGTAVRNWQHKRSLIKEAQ